MKIFPSNQHLPKKLPKELISRKILEHDDRILQLSFHGIPQAEKWLGFNAQFLIPYFALLWTVNFFLEILKFFSPNIARGNTRYDRHW